MSIDYRLHAHIATITINRPETRNSLDMAHFRDLAQAWAAFRDDAGAWVAVITGVGRDFCTGADLKKFIPELTGDLPKPEGWDKDDAIHAVLHRFPVYKPIIAAVNGTCVAGGFEMLGCTDIRVAVPEARFAVMEPKRGLFAGGGSTVRLPRQTGNREDAGDESPLGNYPPTAKRRSPPRRTPPAVPDAPGARSASSSHDRAARASP